MSPEFLPRRLTTRWKQRMQMNRKQRVLQYLSEALDLIQTGRLDDLPILGRLDNAAIAAGMGGWREVYDTIDEAEDCFILGRHTAAIQALDSAVRDVRCRRNVPTPRPLRRRRRGH